MITLEEQIRQLADAVDDQLAVPADVARSSAPRSRRWTLAAAAAVFVLGGIGVVAAVARLGDAEPEADGTPSADTQVTSQASCAFEYNSSTLAERSWAFDGTLISLGSGNDSRLGAVPTATFSVNQWYRGGESDQVTVQFEAGPIFEFAGEIDAGERLLVVGEPRWGGQPLDDPVAWGCGFTQRWSADAAETWTNAFGA